MPDTKPIAPFAAGPIWSMAGVVASAQLIAAIVGSGYWFDEVYMVAIGRHHLDWGSADQPPLTPAVAALVDTLFPGSVVALRIPAIVATAGCVVVAGLIARELGCDRRAQLLVAAAQATALWTNLAGHWLTPYTLEPVEWLLLLWLLVRWIRTRDDRLLLMPGVVVGVAAMTKFQVLLLCAVMLVAVAAFGPRSLLRTPALWAGTGLAAVIASPTLVWQAMHGWPQLKMAPIVAQEAGPLYGGRPGIAVTLIVFAGVAMTMLLGYGVWRLLRAEELREYRFLAAAFLVLYVVFVATGGRPYYLGGGYALFAAAGALGLQRRREAGPTRWRWAAWPVYALSAVAAVAALILGAILTRSDVPEQIAAHTADVYHRLPEQQRDRTAVVGESYIVAAYLDGYAERYGLPEAFSTTRSYGYFDPPRDDQDVVLFVGSDPTRWRPYFGRVAEVGDVSGEIKAWLLTERREPWDVLWARLRTLSVA
ncbi:MULTISPECIES: ArnT family glycosyltransferase [unclassified Mycobacterium]|uniref:ArnT family glycosyltransferase n=1 Tax=unclassified Mycobacterium TaxID=2642494 RepID=UPI0029C74DD4|nr:MULTISPECIES: glycosyltransferase family 39 protein [unclassified Mycobacterium]